MRRLLAVPAMIAAIAIAAGCGGGKKGGPGNSVTGTIAGNAYGPKSAVFATVATDTAGNALTIALTSDDPDLCGSIGLGGLKGNTKVMEFIGGTITGSGTSPITAPGTYEVLGTSGAPSSTNVVQAVFVALDTSCNAISGSSTQSAGGSLDVTGVSTSNISGKGSVDWQTGDTTPVTFSWSSCAALDALVASTNGLVCLH